MTTSAARKHGGRGAAVGRRLRQTALALLLGFAVVALWPEPPTICHQEVVQGAIGVVTLCEPLGLMDPRVVLYLVLVGAVVLPDLLA